jgi:adenylate kinase family enzyme
VILGNAGSGKSTMARRLNAGTNIPRLSLDDIAWNDGEVRRPLEESLRELHRFVTTHDQWILEGCYGDLVEAALPFCTELRFLNPGVEACVQHCRQRPWEPEKFGSREEQDALLDTLIQWVRDYDTRDDEYGLTRHQKLYEDFSGPKKLYATIHDYDDG